MIVDFWATWCGPCKTLGPALEKAVLAAKGAVKLVKIDIDKNPVFAGQLRVQSIPTVYAFVDGRPVDGFMGAVPESQIKAFIDRLAARAAAARPARRSTTCWRWPRNRSSWATSAARRRPSPQALQAEPDNVAGDRRPRAAATWPAAIPSARRRSSRWPRPTPRTPTWRASAPRWRWPRTRRPTPPSSSSAWPPTRPTTRRGLELAKALAGRGEFQGAADQLLTIIEADREWNDEAARKQLLTVFEAAGAASDVAQPGPAAALRRSCSG